MVTRQWVLSPPGAHTGASQQDIESRLADVDAAIARSDWAVTVTLARDLGPLIDDLARPAYGSNIGTAAKLAGESQEATHSAWLQNTALDDANQRSDGAAAKKAAQTLSNALHLGFSKAKSAITALRSGGSGGGFPWLWAGTGAALLLLGVGAVFAAKARPKAPPPRSTWLPPEPVT
jgi:hypothetical protein